MPLALPQLFGHTVELRAVVFAVSGKDSGAEGLAALVDKHAKAASELMPAAEVRTIARRTVG